MRDGKTKEGGAVDDDGWSLGSGAFILRFLEGNLASGQRRRRKTTCAKLGEN